jgi:hypothetical protein
LYVNDAGACVCAGEAYNLVGAGKPDSGPCICQSSTPTLCGYDSGAPPLCVDETSDPANCGGCNTQCKPAAACVNSKCGVEPTTLVAAASGCGNISLVYASKTIYWADQGHGTINSIGTDGTGMKVLASGQTAPFDLVISSGNLFWIDSTTGDGGVGADIMELVSASTTPITLVSMGPPPSAVAVDGGLELPGGTEAIAAITPSVDGSTLYFSAGTRIYKVPTGAANGTVSMVGYAEGPEHGFPEALVADSTWIYYPTASSGNVEVMSLSPVCDATGFCTSCSNEAAAAELCPVRIAESQGSLVASTIAVDGSYLYWGNGSNVREGNVPSALAGSLSGDDFPLTIMQEAITGFAIGTTYGYYGEDDPMNPFGYIEKGLIPSKSDGGSNNSIMLARNQPNARSFAVDGTNVYWTTNRCDIVYIADSPQ